MQYSRCTVVMHEGRFKVEKENVSVPEIVLLRRLHGGDDAVQNIRPQRWKRVQSFRAEKQRLLSLYGHKESQARIIDALFPGEFPRLPTSLKDILTGNPVLDGEDGPDAEDYGDAAAPAKKRARAKGGPVRTEPTPVMIAVPNDDDGIQVEGEEDDGPVPLSDEPEIEDYSFLNEKAAAEG